MILATALFLGVYEPLDRQHRRLSLQVAAEQKTLNEIHVLADAAASLRGTQAATGKMSPDETLLAVLNTTAASHDLDSHIKRVVPNGTTEASISFNNIAFDQLISWLILLREHHGIEITRIVVDKTSGVGQVNANLTVTSAL